MGDHKERQADAEPAKVTADIFQRECRDKSETACRSEE